MYILHCKLGQMKRARMHVCNVLGISVVMATSYLNILQCVDEHVHLNYMGFLRFIVFSENDNIINLLWYHIIDKRGTIIQGVSEKVSYMKISVEKLSACVLLRWENMQGNCILRWNIIKPFNFGLKGAHKILKLISIKLQSWSRVARTCLFGQNCKLFG